jgi:ring-1,2-phenylacetyl-CoA epoxidase subunit PaaC
MQDNIKQPLQQFILQLADNLLVMGHRNSEWTGLGPIIEEDIAFASIAQDQVGQAWNLYQLLESEFGFAHPDQVAFTRNEKEFYSSHLVEQPTGEYDFSLARHYFYDLAQLIRYEMLSRSSYEPLAKLAKKFHGEVKYHVFHAQTWMKQLMDGNEVSKARMQSAVNDVFPFAMGAFESVDGEEALIAEGIFEGESALKDAWMQQVGAQLLEWGYSLPQLAQPVLGGGKGYHSEYLQPLLDEMGEVFRLDPSAEW